MYICVLFKNWSRKTVEDSAHLRSERHASTGLFPQIDKALQEAVKGEGNYVFV